MLKVSHVISVAASKGGRDDIEKVVQFDLLLEVGKIYTLQGPNQSGKSTLIKTIMGSHRRRGGINVILNREELWLKTPADAISHGIVAVFQDDELIPSMTLRGQLRLRHACPRWNLLKNTKLAWLSYPTEWLQKRLGNKDFLAVRPPCLGADIDVDERALTLLHLYSNSGTDYTNILDKLPRELSGGAKAVARLVSAQLTPGIKLLLLDEVFRGVQANVWPAIVDNLRDWADVNTVTLLSVTHNEDEVIRWQPDRRFEIDVGADGGVLQEIPPSGYFSLTAGLPQRVRHFPVFYIHEEHAWIQNLELDVPVLLLADKKTKDTSAYNALRDALSAKYCNSFIELAVDVDESIKNWSNVASVLGLLADKVPQQGSSIVIVGGGVTLNFAGFIASTLHRGVQFVLVPTTIMAVADVAVGSKTSVNFIADSGARKHLLGTYSNPSAVILDDRFMDQLPEREVRLGLSECLKHGLLQDKELFDSVLDALNTEIAGNAWKKDAFKLAVQTMELKSEILLQDPWEEKGLGYLLLYGHLHAHSLERFCKFELAHGLSVYIGIMIDLLLANQNTLFQNICAAVRSSGLHEDSQLNALAQSYMDAESTPRLRAAYEHDPKIHHHGEERNFRYLSVNKIAEFQNAGNEKVVQQIKPVELDLVFETTRKVLDNLMA